MMKLTPTLFLTLACAGAGSGCVPTAGPTDELSQAGTLSQGTLSQGTLSQGTLSQGTLSQGTDNAVWGFHLSGWRNAGMTLVDSKVDKGRLSAKWGSTDACADVNQPGSRECGWAAAGASTCTPGSTVKVGAGCGLGQSSDTPLLRVCNGSRPCLSEAAIASGPTGSKRCANGDGASVSFTCPARGRYFVMIGPKVARSTDGFTFTVASTPAGAFTTELSGADLEGTTIVGESGALPGANAATYSIVSTSNVPLQAGDEDVGHDPTGSTSFYYLEKPGILAQPLCLGDDLNAIPLAGVWRDGAFHRSSDTFFSFGCQAGVLAKCYLHAQYRPWDKTAQNESLDDYFQTCTRAARADFCSDGRSFTVDNTTIDLWDRAGHDTEDTSIPSLAMEALWTRDPTVSGDVWAPHPPACLSKKRWDTLPFNGPCVDVTPDPRTHGDVNPPLFCDQRPVRPGFGHPDAWLSNPNIIEVTKSAFIDSGLWRWRRRGTNEQRVTTQLTTTENQPDYFLFPGSDPPEPTFLGAVYSADGSAGVRPSYAIPLYSYYNPTTTDYATTTLGKPDPNYLDGVLEGYINDKSCLHATPRCPTDKPLYLYRTSNGDSFLSIPGVSLPANTQLPGTLLGYLPR